MGEQRCVHVVDDDEAIRKSVGFMLRTAGFNVETYASGMAFLTAAPGAEMGCVVLDMHMPGMDGPAVQAAMIRGGVEMPVVVLTGNGDLDLAVQAMRAGAVDFLSKPIEKATLLEAIQRGFARLDGAGGRKAEEADARTQIDGLTSQERNVLEGLAQGHSNNVIANGLGVSSRVVEVLRANLMRKLGVQTLAETLRIAFAAGLGRSPQT
jgi:two-component system response regulator FixJ